LRLERTSKIRWFSNKPSSSSTVSISTGKTEIELSVSVICLRGRCLDGFRGFPTEDFLILAGGSSFFPPAADV